VLTSSIYLFGVKKLNPLASAIYLYILLLPDLTGKLTRLAIKVDDPHEFSEKWATRIAPVVSCGLFIAGVFVHRFLIMPAAYNAIQMHPGLQFISSLFSYPAVQAEVPSVTEIPGTDVNTLLGERKAIDHIRFENEYVRLFINALPEVPCAPYGSEYLEGSVMGESTLKVAEIYRKYGIESPEPADHITVESEFLAWLHGPAATDGNAREDFTYLLGHLRQWTGPFFSKVAGHDQLGCFRQYAQVARSVLDSLE
jgi:TorA maturation chaperone TorD